MKTKLLLRGVYTAGWFIVALCIFQGTGIADEKGWPGFSGSTGRTGEISDAFIKEPLEISWSYKIEDKSNGFVDWGAAAAHGRIYTADGLNNILVLNAADGSLIWKKKVVSNLFTVTLSPDGKTLYATTAITTKPSPTLFAFDAETGDELWNNMINDQPAVGGMEGAPILHEGVIYAGHLQYEGRGGAAAYDAKTGKLLWYTPVPRFSPYSPLTYGEGKIFIGFENKSIYCFDAKDGRILWQSAQLADLPFTPSIFIENRLYLRTGGTVYSLDPSSGAMLWQKALDLEGGHGGMAYHEKILYGGGRDGKFFALQADAGGLLWIKDLGLGGVESSPLIDFENKKIYLATQGNYAAVISSLNGNVLSKVKLSEDPRGVWKNSPAVYQGKMYVGSLDRTFYAVE